jgi:hypothetical protein
MVYKLLETAQKRWKRIKGFDLLALVVNNVKFKDGEQVQDQLRIPANVTGHSGDRDRFAHGHHAEVGFVL